MGLFKIIVQMLQIISVFRLISISYFLKINRKMSSLDIYLKISQNILIIEKAE